MKRIVLFRIDDVCPTMNREKFDRVLKLLEEVHIKPLLGVVPDNKDAILEVESKREDFWEYMRGLKRQGYPIAMHGFQHVYDSKKRGIVNGTNVSEFAGHAYDIQRNKIENGLEILKREGLDTNIFFAPGHSYDHNTIKALHSVGFEVISDGRSHWMYELLGVKFIPCRMYETRVKGHGIVTICLHTNNMSEKHFEHLEQLISLNKSSFMNFSEVQKKGKMKNVFLQQLDEKVYVFYSRYIRFYLSPYYQRIKSKLRI